MNFEKLSKLQEIATGNIYSEQSSFEKTQNIKTEKIKQYIKNLETELKNMYSNNKEKVFSSFKQETNNIPLPNEDVKEFYWNKYLKLHPVDSNQAKQELIKETELKLQTKETPNEKEYYLREQVSRWPKWLIEEFKDDLQNFSTRNADTNLNKAKLVYKDNLKYRLENLFNKPLDPEVPQEAHKDDMLKLEKMNLLDVADIVNGRFGVMGDKNNFIPAFDLMDRSQVFPQDRAGAPNLDEQLMIDDIAPEFIDPYIKRNIETQRSKINLDNKTSEGLALSLLETGALKPDKWKEAFSMFSKPEYVPLISKGLKGEIEAGRIKSDEDLVKSIYTVLNQYKDVLGVNENAPNT